MGHLEGDWTWLATFQNFNDAHAWMSLVTRPQHAGDSK
jgi:hypothetical protein